MHDEATIAILKALADKTRLDIVRQLAHKSRPSVTSCGEVSECSSLSQPAMSHHLRKLVDAGVIKESKNGVEKYYELNTALLNRHGINALDL